MSSGAINNTRGEPKVHMNTHMHIEDPVLVIEIPVACPFRIDIPSEALFKFWDDYHLKSRFRELYPFLLILTVGLAASLPACWDTHVVTGLCFVFSEPSFLPHWSGWVPFSALWFPCFLPGLNTFQVLVSLILSTSSRLRVCVCVSTCALVLKKHTHILQ